MAGVHGREPFSYTVTPLGGRLVVTLRGELDASTAPEFVPALLELADGPDLILDLRHLTLIDSSGLAALVAGYRRVSEYDGVLALIGVPRFLSRMLALTQLDRVIPVLDVA
ncbi:anti-sigma B factor antagonist [Amycolatopsis bartoniae]|uniref:Anti-sigma factor antagonist n=1 Tax=Amycolatopsis bartoniae TaxID=941986 RepID=A0A8H9IZ08_9PSEU|nr:STAS domain-containing protein [Amycolatopsis bartoniae]MBB2937124.1 anti-sigma B factor antagonist [Amycolatopsis bartoniae]TVT05999.1 STAS domain-containing protein [Amycolatopsis bartoniae]GHF52600.1 hypothetical protein GCM10017566_27470 [Amycolatopsis bartoniae]